MYAGRGSGAQVANLIDMTTSSQWPNVDAFAGSEAMYIPLTGAVGASYATVAAALTAVGLDDFSVKPMVGDWVYWQDNATGQLRLMSPATFVAAFVAALSPHLSTLNQPIPGIVGTQR